MDRQELKELLDGISKSLDIELGEYKSTSTLQNDVGTIKSNIAVMQSDMATIKMILETTVQDNFNRLVEGHIGLIRQLDEMKYDVRNLRHELNGAEWEINEK